MSNKRRPHIVVEDKRKGKVVVLPTFDQVEITGDMTLDGDMRLRGNVTVDSDIQLNGSETVSGNLQVNGNQTILLDFRVNGDQTVAGSLRVDRSVDALGSIQAAAQLLIANLPTLPVGLPAVQQVRYYNPGIPDQPGLVLKGTNGMSYILFVDTSGGTPNLAIQLA